MIIEAIVENPKGSRVKYELTKTGKLRFDQRLPAGFKFPGNYGFFPGTLGGDGDALDVLILGRKLKRKQKIKVKPIGIMFMVDSGKKDDKILAISCRAKGKRLNKEIKSEIEYFFKHYKRRKISIKGFGGVNDAKKAIRAAQKRAIEKAKKDIGH